MASIEVKIKKLDGELGRYKEQMSKPRRKTPRPTRLEKTELPSLMQAPVSNLLNPSMKITSMQDLPGVNLVSHLKEEAMVWGITCAGIPRTEKVA